VHLEVADYPPQRILFNTLKYALLLPIRWVM